VQATVVSLELQLAGDVADYSEGGPVMANLEATLRISLSCLSPVCVLELIAKPGSVVLDVRMTIPDTRASLIAGVASEVVAAANTMTTLTTAQLTSSIGVPFLNVPATPTVANGVPALILTAPPPPLAPPPAAPPPNSQHSTQTITLNAGWTWISSPLISGLTNQALGSMSGLANSYTDSVKDQYQFTNYVPGFGWIGALVSLNPFTCYKVYLNVGGEFVLNGFPTDPTGTTYVLNQGWTWIGWPALTPQPVTALVDAIEDVSKFTTLNERIKSQYQFTSWVPGYGFFGELQLFEPGKGYMIELTQPNRLNSFGAPRSSVRTGRQRQLEPMPNELKPHVVTSGSWLIKPDTFEYSMCVVAVVVMDGVVAEDGALAAFVNDQLRGVARPSPYKAPVGPYKGFVSYNLMAYGHLEAEGELVTFQYRHADGRTSTLERSMSFAKDTFRGSIVDPFVIVHTTKPHAAQIVSALAAAVH